MARVISVHEYPLKEGVDEAAFRAVLAWGKAVLPGALPGLETVHMVRGLRGRRRGGYAALWVYASREAWEALWGPPEKGRTPEEYPEIWKTWEARLAPFLACAPDAIPYTAYEEIIP